MGNRFQSRAAVLDHGQRFPMGNMCWDHERFPTTRNGFGSRAITGTQKNASDRITGIRGTAPLGAGQILRKLRICSKVQAGAANGWTFLCSFAMGPGSHCHRCSGRWVRFHGSLPIR
eukprot:gene15426-biopygen653